MRNFLKKYWILILIAVIAVNFLGFYLLKESVGISDALEHVDSERVIQKLKQKDFFYTLFIDAVLILDFSLILFSPYLVIRSLIKNKNRK
ncbi:MAG: hypothetical protein LBE92_13900 [Chryseobacterium sp.]|jgi:hypothetical protein|uniref:hypothetical protein n=1 Tax=Chryseobacterium sp. TaxID=1871047 RepID=UPI0028242F0B|nr:hypothetical protein [Chryseobacterium sp.]MDR2237210.1 hypothetical protein [Chryseobacterium sp.]